MTTLKLHLLPVAAKYFLYYHDSVESGPRHLRNEIRDLVKAHIEKHATGIISTPIGMESVDVCIASQIAYSDHDARSAVYIPEKKMRLLNSILIKLFEHEINLTVDLYLTLGKQQKDAILYVFDKYGIDGDYDYKYDRATKMNQRYRKKLALQ